jgi:hypothetical protein
MLRDEHIFCMLDNKVQRKMSGTEKDEGGDKFRILHMKSFVIHTDHLGLLV